MDVGYEYYRDYGKENASDGNSLNNQLNANGGKQKMTEYEAVNPGIWKPVNSGEFIEGQLISVQDSSKYENNKIYHLECDDKRQFAIFGTKVLDDRMSFIKVGEKIKIVFKGTQKNSKGQDTKIFEVQREKKVVA